MSTQTLEKSQNGTVPKDDVFPVATFKEAKDHLRRPFTPEAVKWKVQSELSNGSFLVVGYIDARHVIERLNLVLCDAWEDEEYDERGKGMLCKLTVGGVTRRDFGDGYVGKGLYSDSFKRAAVKFGVGVSIYAIPKQYLKGDDQVKKYGKSTYIQPDGERKCRQAYKAWLDATGKKIFGEPLDHGDTVDSVGDIEATAVPVDTREPTDKQREQVEKLMKSLGLFGHDREMKFRAHGIELGMPTTKDKVNGLIIDLLDEIDKRAD